MPSEAAAQTLPAPVEPAGDALEELTPDKLAAKILMELRFKPPRRPSVVLRENGIVDSIALSELFEKIPRHWRDSYARACGGYPSITKRITFRVLDGFFPEWGDLFLDALHAQAAAGDTPKISKAVKAMQEMEIPVKVGWIYARMSPASPTYDADFAYEVRGATSTVLNEIQERLEGDLADAEDPKLSSVRLSYLKAHPDSPMTADKAVIEVKKTQHDIQEKRLTFRQELVGASSGLLERAKARLIDVSETSSGTDERSGGADDGGAEGGSTETEGEGEEEAGEEKG